MTAATGVRLVQICIFTLVLLSTDGEGSSIIRQNAAESADGSASRAEPPSGDGLLQQDSRSIQHPRSLQRPLQRVKHASASDTSASLLGDIVSYTLHYVVRYVRTVVSRLLRLIGEWLPLRGFASLATDIGLPWAPTILDLMNEDFELGQRNGLPRTWLLAPPPHATSWSGTTEMASRRISHRMDAQLPERQSWRHADDESTYSDDWLEPFYPEIQSAIGATLRGQRECSLRLACLLGKRLSSVNGANTLTMTVSLMKNQLPAPLIDLWKQHADLLEVLTNSVMYTTDCERLYPCAQSQSQTATDDASSPVSVP